MFSNSTQAANPVDQILNFSAAAVYSIATVSSIAFIIWLATVVAL
jgi:hypothetical protein